MGIPQDGQASDWGDRCVWWLRQRFPNWPIKAIAREIDEPESVVKSWWQGHARPDRKKLQKLVQQFAKDGLTSFVFGAPCHNELHAKIERLSAQIIELQAYLRAPSRVVVGDAGGGPVVVRDQDSRKAVK
jgi:hypothetical protein